MTSETNLTTRFGEARQGFGLPLSFHLPSLRMPFVTATCSVRSRHLTSFASVEYFLSLDTFVFSFQKNRHLPLVPSGPIRVLLLPFGGAYAPNWPAVFLVARFPL